MFFAPCGIDFPKLLYSHFFLWKLHVAVLAPTSRSAENLRFCPSISSLEIPFPNNLKSPLHLEVWYGARRQTRKSTKATGEAGGFGEFGQNTKNVAPCPAREEGQSKAVRNKTSAETRSREEAQASVGRADAVLPPMPSVFAQRQRLVRAESRKAA